MPNHGALNITPSAVQQSRGAGYISGLTVNAVPVARHRSGTYTLPYTNPGVDTITSNTGPNITSGSTLKCVSILAPSRFYTGGGMSLYCWGHVVVYDRLWTTIDSIDIPYGQMGILMVRCLASLVGTQIVLKWSAVNSNKISYTETEALSIRWLEA